MGSHDSLKAHHIMGTNLAEKNQQQGIEEYKESPNGVTGEDVLQTAKESSNLMERDEPNVDWGVLVETRSAVKNTVLLMDLRDGDGISNVWPSLILWFCSIEECGEHIIAGAGEFHLEICLKDLQDDFMGGA
ncbi:hypothetical protein GBA52_013529 [Prunus armeniaca]|nr:hypothetical protein GBA52_013529 [Prunus armeniaca]